ncbi:tonB-dependent Receptor Plug domain protein, partial [Vibrio parahaemolyticus V-223/04]
TLTLKTSKSTQVLVPSLPVIKLRKPQRVRLIMRYSAFRVLKFRMKAERAYCLTFPYVV